MRRTTGKLPYAGAREGRERSASDATPFDFWVAPKPLPPEQPLLIFEHIRKTAGTSLRRVIDKNCEGATRLQLDVPKTSSGELSLADWHRRFYLSLTKKERASLVCVASHSANFLIPVVDRPFRAFCLLRDPIDRVLSRYYFFGRTRQWTLKELYGGEPDRERKDEFFNGQARRLLEPHYDISQLGFTNGPPPDADAWRARLFKVLSTYYTVGVQAHFMESIELFASVFGWRKLVSPEVRVNDARPRDLELDDETYELIRAHNWLDVELYRHYEAGFGARQAEEDDAPGAVSRPGYLHSQKDRSPKGAHYVEEQIVPELEALRQETVALRVRVAQLERLLQSVASYAVPPADPLTSVDAEVKAKARFLKEIGRDASAAGSQHGNDKPRAAKPRPKASARSVGPKARIEARSPVPDKDD